MFRGISVLNLRLQSGWSLPACVCQSHQPPGGEASVPEGQLRELRQEQLGLLYLKYCLFFSCLALSPSLL